MKLQQLISVVHAMMADSFPLCEIKHYSHNLTPANDDDYHYCVIELFQPAAPLQPAKSLFVLFNTYESSAEVIFEKEYHSGKYSQVIKMHLFENVQKIIFAEMGKKLYYFDISNHLAGKQKVFAGTGSISAPFMNSYEKLTFRENTWGEIVKSNLPEYIGMISDDDSFLIINIKTWTIVEMIKDILPMLEVEQFSVLQKNNKSKRLFAILSIRSEFYDYSRERIGVWEIKLSKKGGNYGIPRGTYAIDGYKDLKASFINNSLVVDVEAADSTNSLLFK